MSRWVGRLARWATRFTVGSLVSHAGPPVPPLGCSLRVPGVSAPRWVVSLGRWGAQTTVWSTNPAPDPIGLTFGKPNARLRWIELPIWQSIGEPRR